MLEVRNVGVRFGSVLAVDAVDLTLAEGERLALLGPSGCGKSTLLRAMAGLEPAHTGEIRLDGVSITSHEPHQRPFGLMFQDHALFPHRNVAANVSFGLRMAGIDPAERQRRTAELLALVELAGYGDRDVTTLSGGEAQRVALARALAPSPRVLLLDEPLGSLDRRLRDQLIDQLPRVLDVTGTAAIHVTHDHEEAFAIGDRLAVMAAGRLVQVGTPRYVWSRPQTPAIARFLGHANIVETPEGAIMWRADAAVPSPTGAYRGIVRGSRFQGPTSATAVELGDGVEVIFDLADAPSVGDEFVFDVDPARTHTWPDSAPHETADQVYPRRKT